MAFLSHIYGFREINAKTGVFLADLPLAVCFPDFI
jgi:hypothetical protein